LQTPYIYYKSYVFPKVMRFRGSHRLLLLLKKLAASAIAEIEDEPESIFNKGDWDNLIILDACRHDLYEELTDREVEQRVSLGSTTTEYIERTFSEGDFSDVVYISANPFFSDKFLEKLIGGSDVFAAKFDVFNNSWDVEEGTVMPEDVAEAAKTAKKLFPEKKLIIHFIQPHYPFIGFEDEGFDESSKWLDDNSKNSVWDRAELGELGKEEVWTAYKGNLEKVLPYAEDLVEDLKGKTIITSDHGNLVGENGLYGHPGRTDLKPLREVPWDVRE
ncbi:MAG: hypothetical protein ABEI86_11645, partial [Halobacteriaceae archaeon]